MTVTHAIQQYLIEQAQLSTDGTSIPPLRWRRDNRVNAPALQAQAMDW